MKVIDGTVHGFNMENYRSRTSCGTVCCIAGAIIEFEAHRQGVTPEEIMGGTSQGYEHEAAEQLCGLSQAEAIDLFIPRGTGPYSFISPQRAAATIRRYLATGRVEWDFACV